MDQLLDEGDLFEIPSQKYFNPKWMKKFDEGKDEAKPAPKKRVRKASKVIEQPEPETLKDVTDNTPKDTDWV